VRGSRKIVNQEKRGRRKNDTIQGVKARLHFAGGKGEGIRGRGGAKKRKRERSPSQF